MAQHLLGSGVTCLNDPKMLCSMAHHQRTSTHQKVFPRAAFLDRYIHVAGLPSIAEQQNASLPSFADEMSLYCSQKTEEACRDASQALDAISLSLQEIGLTMNTDKTTAMVVNPRRKTQSMASQTAGGSIYCQGRQKWQLYRVLEF